MISGVESRLRSLRRLLSLGRLRSLRRLVPSQTLGVLYVAAGIAADNIDEAREVASLLGSATRNVTARNTSQRYAEQKLI